MFSRVTDVGIGFNSYLGVKAGAAVLRTYRSRTVESFKRASRKARQRGLRLLSYHFTGDKFVSQWGR